MRLLALFSAEVEKAWRRAREPAMARFGGTMVETRRSRDAGLLMMVMKRGEKREQLLVTMPVVVLLWCGRCCLACPARLSSSQGNSSDQITGRPKAAFLSRPACLAHFHVPLTALLRQRAVIPRDPVHLPLSINLQLSAYKTARRHQRYHEIPPSTRLEGRVSG
jgi:hypothetical protein